MGRRSPRRDPLDLLPPLFGLLMLGAFFVPGFLQLVFGLLLWIAILAGAVGSVALIVWLVRRRKRTQAPNWFAEPVKITPTPRPAMVYAPDVEVDTRPRQGEPMGWSLELLGKLEWKRFEDVVANYFTRQGYRAETTRIGADGGVDVYLYRAQVSAPEAVVQCKAWNVYDVGVKPVRELFGVMAAAKISQGYFVTTGSFTQEARHFGRDNEIVLINGDDLLDRFRQLTSSDSADLLEFATAGDYATPTCPRCGVKMVTRTSSKDQSTFWGCRHFPRCRQTFKAAS